MFGKLVVIWLILRRCYRNGIDSEFLTQLSGVGTVSYTTAKVTVNIRRQAEGRRFSKFVTICGGMSCLVEAHPFIQSFLVQHIKGKESQALKHRVHTLY